MIFLRSASSLSQKPQEDVSVLIIFLQTTKIKDKGQLLMGPIALPDQNFGWATHHAHPIAPA